MKDLLTVSYKKIGEDGYYACIEHRDTTARGWGEEEFFAEDWKTLCDRVLFYVVTLVQE